MVVQCSACQLGNAQEDHQTRGSSSPSFRTRAVTRRTTVVPQQPGGSLAVASTDMTARAVLICRPNSHPFQERTLTLDQPVKIGRSVARVRPAPNNSIFDCKVLSRNHALLWYDNGKFYLQDTKSSNGTFVNNQRLSKGSEESAPREVCSGDIVQFGVDVMENSRKVTHGCIVATLKLYLPDGKEAKASPTTGVSSGSAVPLQDLYQLNQYLQEAMQREHMLENKLAMIQRLVKSTKEAAESGWKSLIDEDRLLTRIEILESQLQTYSKGFTEDKVREEVRLLHEDKDKYQATAKESLLRMLQEKMEAVKKLQEVERALSNTEDECLGLKELCEKNQEELQEMGAKYGGEQKRAEELSLQVQDQREKHKEEVDRLEQERKELQYKLEDKTSSSTVDDEKMRVKIESLREKKDEEEDEEKAAEEEDANDMAAVEEEAEEEEDEDEEEPADVVQTPSLLVRQLQEKVRLLEAQLEAHSAPTPDNEEESESESSSSSVLVANGTLVRGSSGGGGGESSPGGPDLQLQRLQEEVQRLQELGREAEEKRRQAEEQSGKLSKELDVATGSLRRAFDEANSLKKQLKASQEKLQRREDVAQESQEQQRRSSAELEKRLAGLTAQLEEERCRGKAAAAEAEALRRQLRSWRQREPSREGGASFPGEAEEVQRIACRLREAEGQLVTLKEKYALCHLEKTHLQGSLKGMQEDLKSVLGKSQRALLYYLVPLAVVFLAILIAFHPST